MTKAFASIILPEFQAFSNHPVTTCKQLGISIWHLDRMHFWESFPLFLAVMVERGVDTADRDAVTENSRVVAVARGRLTKLSKIISRGLPRSNHILVRRRSTGRGGEGWHALQYHVLIQRSYHSHQNGRLAIDEAAQFSGYQLVRRRNFTESGM